MIKNPDGTVTISEEDYDELIADQRFLSCLEAGGVDNWEWYDEARKDYQEQYGDEGD